jgi:hypothetical protein
LFAAALVFGFGSCLGPKRPLIQGMIGATSFDKLEFDGSGTGPPATSDPDVMPTLGFAVQQSLTRPEAGWDAGLEGGANVGFVVNQYAFLVGGGGGTVVVSANSPFIDLFGGGWVGRHFENGMRIFAGAGPLWLIAWAESNDPRFDFADSSSRFGTYVRGGIEFDIGPAGTLGVTVQRIDSELVFDTVGRAELTGYTFSISLTRYM